jgi:cytochrome c peroxidase
MKRRIIKLAVIAVLLAGAGVALLLSNNSEVRATNRAPSAGMADPNNLIHLYDRWKENHLKAGLGRNIVLPLAWSNVLSTERTAASGQATLDLTTGTVAVRVAGLPQADGWDLWLVHGRSDHTLIPESGDDMRLIGSLELDGNVATFDAQQGPAAFSGFNPQLAIVTRAGQSPDRSRVLVGAATLFDSIYRSEQLGRLGILGDNEDKDQTPPAAREKPSLLSRLSAILGTVAEAQGPPPGISSTVAAGRLLFLNGTFGGNGRSCATCHRENVSFTLTIESIATLPQTDPLFVAETNPDLKGLENPPVMHGAGCILENHDGFAKPGVLRGIPHTLSLTTTLNPDSDLLASGHDNALGWSGDGSPTGNIPDGQGGVISTSGRLIDFMIGAVRQHYTKTLNRVAGVDFVFPNTTQLQQLEAFMLSLGRQSDLDLVPGQPDTLILKGALASLGEKQFQATFGQLACNSCHQNAGATFLGTNINGNVDTHVEDLPANEQPARLIDPTIPRDDGFSHGADANTFNIPPLVEASFTPPFFHNNSINTLEAAVGFYTFAFSSKFQGSATSFQPEQGFTPTTQQAIAAFIRVIGSLEKIHSTINLENRAADPTATNTQAVELLEIAEAELSQGVTVLTQSQLHPTAVVDMNQALAFIQQAISASTVTSRNEFIQKAITEEKADNADMQVQGPF